MKKNVGLVILGVVGFDLGVVPVTVEAAPKYELTEVLVTSISKMSNDQFYLKLNSKDLQASSKACASKNGHLVNYKGADYCQIPKAGSAKSK